jgi:hypothetical protein
MMPLAIRSTLKSIKPLHTTVQVLRHRIRRLRVNAWLLEGRERTSGQPLSILFMGARDSRNYISSVYFGETWTEKGHSRVLKSRRLQHALDANGVHDLAVVQIDEPGPITAAGATLFQVPCWVRGEKDIHGSLEYARRSKHIKSDIRRIRKNRLGYRVTSEPGEFDCFYHNMYLPYVRKVFGDHVFLMQYEAMKAAIPHCELFLVTQDGQDIAGGILVYDGSDKVRGWSLGVKDGDDCWVRAGALAAFEQLQTEYLLEKGFSRLHRGGSRPFLNDGALCFKKNRGMKITDRTGQQFIIAPLSDCPAVRTVLQENPFIYEDEGLLKGAIFVSGEVSTEDAARLYHDWYIAGLEGLSLFSLGETRDQAMSIRTCGWIDALGVLNKHYSKV